MSSRAVDLPPISLTHVPLNKSKYKYIYICIIKYKQQKNIPGESWSQQLSKVCGLWVRAYAANNSKPDLESVQRDAVMSQPKRAEDIPPMVAFVNRWGGGGSEAVFAQEIITYVKSGLIHADNKHISGSFWVAMNKLVFPPEFQPILFLHAVVLTHASGDNVVDHMCRNVSHGDIQKIGTDGLKAAVKNANAILMNSRKLTFDHELKPHERATVLLPLYQRVVKIVLPSMKAEEGFDTIEKCVTAFAAHLASIIGGPVAQPQPPISRSDGTVLRASSSSAVMQFDNFGQPLHAHRQSLANQGFEVGMFVERKDRTDDSDRLQLSKLCKVLADGSVELAAMHYDGSIATDVLTVEFEDFQQQYRPTNKPIKLFTSEKSSLEVSSSLLIKSLTGHVNNSIEALVGQQTADAQILVHELPRIAVFADQDFPVGSLVLVPATLTVTAYGEHETAKYEGKITATIKDQPYRFALGSMAPSSDCAAAFWCVQSPKKPENANMKLEIRTLTAPVPYIASAKREATTRVVEIPVMINHVEIKKGSELFVNKPAINKVVTKKTRNIVLEVIGSKKQKQ